ncbi:MAG TPA: efflux RND transporter permease subunit [Leptolyngbyaceae cyanobacterium M33_DOE_097]|uniref:Efflux RND transporter permease subunit n=1 Tax=Oscillatoriales cyanobacterium SpSt-418 TaxID=2282169 RepID=A0A7C3KFL3_9CYAN|nr:efflux RND transporter permease subunit [Leptolyngbyaceae cyanobacterium M33_DOE_097]
MKSPHSSYKLGFVGKLAKQFIDSKLTPLIILVSLLLGIGATLILPREEEPQITVPMADVFVQMPGASAKDVEQRVTAPMEKLIKELPGVEYVYSTSRPGSSLVIVRFLVGQNTEDSIVQLYNKLYANFDKIPPGVSQPLIKSRSIDDVPILTLTLWGEQSSGAELRQIAAQLDEQIKQVPDVSETTIIGGQKRQLRVDLDPARLNAYGLSPLEISKAFQAQNAELASGAFNQNNQSFLVRTQSFVRSAEDAKGLVVAVANNQPVYLRDVASVTDGSEEPASYVFFGQGKGRHEGEKSGSPAPAIASETEAVTIAIAKRSGANAIQVSHRVLHKLEQIQHNYIPKNVHLMVTRDYGETAAERSNELLFHMLIAVGSVTLLMWFVMGKKEAIVVAVSIPVTLALTLASFVFYGFTLNRVTFFALIFSIGILVDDAIVVVENVGRHLQLPENKRRLQLSTNRRRTLQQIVLEAVDEVGNPTILATLAVIAAILPMAFVGGLMGPYMRPIPLGASAAMIFSALVAFIVVPWTTMRVFSGASHQAHEHGEDALSRLYRKFMYPLVHYPRRGTLFLVATALALVLIVGGLAGFRLVILKMLPFDNKSELQVVVNLPEGTTLEQTARVTREMGQYLATVPEVVNYQSYVGTASPYNFNGLVRHYFLRSGANVADIQVNFSGKGDRKRQSHEIAKAIRPKLKEIGDRYHARIQVAEIPPGPPVLQTLVTEVYGPDYQGQIDLATQIRQLYQSTDGVVDVDWYVEAPQTDYRVAIDREKAALNGISPAQISEVLQMALSGQNAGLLHDENAREDVAINLRFDQASRSSLADLQSINLRGSNGNLVPLSTLVKTEKTIADTSIYHKNLQPVVYVLGDVSGKVESAVYAMLNLQPKIDKLLAHSATASGHPPHTTTYLTQQPPTTETYAIKWDGEWQVTYEVFRDLGIAFAVVLVLIYALVVGWFQSFTTPLVIMAAIPFSLVGIMPAHWLMGSFFTATSMIGFIAGAGIVVRNSIILVDFIELRLKEGMPLEEAVVDAGAVRFRPMLLTAAAVVVGSAIILADPIFQGLAISLMAGEVASLLLSRSAVPILYYKLWRDRKGKQKDINTEADESASPSMSDSMMSSTKPT